MPQSLDDSVIQINKKNKKRVSPLNDCSDDSEGSTLEVTLTVEEPVCNPQSSASSAVQTVEDTKSNKAILREKYLDTLAEFSFTKFDKNSTKQGLVQERTVGNSSNTAITTSKSEERSNTMSSASSEEDAETIKESVDIVNQSTVCAQDELIASTESCTTSSDLDFVTIQENDLPKSVSLIDPTRRNEGKDFTITHSKKRVSFAGDENPCESLASLLQNPDEKSKGVCSGAVAECKVTRMSDDEIDIKKMKVSKKRRADDSMQTPSCNSDTIKRFELNGKGYMQLSVLGKGASSTVHRVMADGNCELYAYKRVDMRHEEDIEQTIANYSNEINLLNKCKGNPYIIHLVDSVINREEAYIGIIMEAGEIDLSSALSNQKKLRKRFELPGVINPCFLRSVWGDMLRSVDHIHDLRIVHGDLKPANFVFVRGDLKLIDFGISKGISNDTTNIVRDSLVGTINYMAPEAVMPTLIPSIDTSGETSSEEEKKKVKYGRASDIWSLGCILYQMLYGVTPFATIKNLPSKIGAIVNPNCEIQYPDNNDEAAVDAIKCCLVRDIHKRASIRGDRGLLRHRLLGIPFTELPVRDKSTKSVGINTVECNVLSEGVCSLEKVLCIIECVFFIYFNEDFFFSSPGF